MQAQAEHGVTFRRRFTAAAERERAVNAAVTSVVEENLSNHALVQAFGREEAEAGRRYSISNDKT